LNPMWAYTTSPPLPGQARPSPRQNPAISTTGRAKDYIAEVKFFSGSQLQELGTCS
jgi:hypothetical protein